MSGAVEDEGSSSVSLSPLQFFSMLSLSPAMGSSFPWLRELKSEERGLCLIQLIVSCANHVAAGSLDKANLCLEQISVLSSPEGDSIQRMAAYFAEALADRILKSWPGLYRALRSTVIPSVAEEILVRKLFFEICPFLKLAFVVSNQAIMEAIQGEKMVHIIDLGSAEPAQWVALLQSLSIRPEGPPHLRITCVHEQKEVLEKAALRLTEEAERLDIAFQFNSIVSKLGNLDMDRLRIKTGEALAISSSLQLHTLLAPDGGDGGVFSNQQTLLHRRRGILGDPMENPVPDSASSSPISAPKIESFLASLWALSPKILVVAEQESNHNRSALVDRLMEALFFYAALFDCFESSVPRASVDRMKVEKMLLGEEIKNIISCEGPGRKERHEKLGRWTQRMVCAGFAQVGLSCYPLFQARRLLQGYGCDGYRIREEDGALMICWQDRALFSVSAWSCKS